MDTDVVFLARGVHADEEEEDDEEPFDAVDDDDVLTMLGRSCCLSPPISLQPLLMSS